MNADGREGIGHGPGVRDVDADRDHIGCAEFGGHPGERGFVPVQQGEPGSFPGAGLRDCVSDP
jgi:hypothetical protein